MYWPWQLLFAIAVVHNFHRCDSDCGAGGAELPDHCGDEGGDEEAQQPVHRPEEVQQLCLLEEEEEEVVLHATPPA